MDVIFNLDSMWQLLILAVSVFLVILVLLVIRRRTKIINLKVVDRALRQLKIDEVKSIVIPDGIGGLIEIERLVLMEQGLLVIESYPISGHLFGAENIDQWTQIIDGRSFKFANPLRHIHNAKQALKILAPKVPVYARIVFTADGDFPKGKPEEVSVLATFEQDLKGLHSAPKMPDTGQACWQRILRIARKNGKPIAKKAVK